ncbi:Rad4 transglutaminase-like domain-containing protein [Neohortaea acidophila]|uniref:Rad4 transglutaminase-like domain-containing protein n=1 Tax=Neohortaea acidophila TaxID=245834 RepID=A0A6A6PXP8_9PEZI|nr:Rad4 transglutaminase-like domain-containing protein [Neohortaea acidophila]KAF2484948.1 Rad4 transglutaminase-like domain-containing protein [Neohortaea acidophila]
MPPFGFRKRERSSSPPVPQKKAKATPSRAKPTLFETVDSPSTNERSLEENKKFLQKLDDDDDASSLSEADSDEFEDVPPAKRRRVDPAEDEDGEQEDEEDEVEWEDAIQPEDTSELYTSTSALQHEPEITDVSISVNDDGTYIEPLVSAATGKKGPSKRERQVRVQTHCLHVQSLMWHNTVRNSWLNDKEVQKTLMNGLTEGVKREVETWKKAMGMSSQPEVEGKAKSKNKRGNKGKQKAGGRDWNAGATHLDPGPRAGDPLLRLLKVLAAYWRKRFLVTAPGLRKQGYKPLRRLRDDIRAWEKDHNRDVEEYGERVESLSDFRKLAKKCEGSRDVGGQLFVALLRGLGLETRMVANLQPIGFGWSKLEEADPKKTKKEAEKSAKVESESDDDAPVIVSSTSKSKKASKKKTLAAENASRKSSRGNKADPINLDDSDSPLSSVPSEPEVDEEEEADDISVIDITPSTPKRKVTKKYDRGMAFPNYWTEVCSPVSHKYYPVDPIVLSTIASNDELLQTFEPRGKGAERMKQVMCYTIAFSADGTAKDVTVRYLKRHQLPGKTKGMRMPVEKIPIMNIRGKIKRYENYDWFRTLMSVYDRPEGKRTAADDLEEQTDLKAFKPTEEKKVVAKESLQGYKQSADFVLEQHLRREEAILPGSEPVKYFMSGKGDKEQELPVYNRGDVVSCKTVESWHKEGREIRTGEQPLKYVPVRAVTLIRKREMEDVQRETGEKMKQGLYSAAQTDWIIPPAIRNGVIPKNAFGNMDVYVPTMVPRGAVHLPLKGSAKLCRKLEIDYAEACTGFEFGKQRAVPILTGVVVAKENEGMVKDAWRAAQKEQKRKEDTKRTATALHWWRKMVLGLRVLERMRVEYAESGLGGGEDVNPFVRREKKEVAGKKVQIDDDTGGGFFPPGYDEEEVPNRGATSGASPDDEEGGGFLVEDGDEQESGGGGFLVEDDSEEAGRATTKKHAPITPVSLQSMHKAVNGFADSDAEESTTAPAKSKNNGTKAKPRQSSAKKGSNKSDKSRTAPTPDESDAESELSDMKSEDDGESDHAATPPPSKRRKTASIQGTRQNGIGSRSRAATKKSTPLKSQYFVHGEADEAETEDESELDANSEVEVVKPRMTTARTRTRAKAKAKAEK